MASRFWPVGVLVRRRRSLIAALVACLAGIAVVGCGDSGSGAEEGTSGSAPTAGLQIRVDRRVELLSVIFRLAGVPPYEEAQTPYALAADDQFAEFAGHPAVMATRALAREQGISYDAPVELAVYLDETMHPTRRLDPPPLGLDPRWQGVDVDRYLRAVRDFAASSGFDAFYRSQAGYRAEVANALGDHLAGGPIIDWLDGIFGELPRASYRGVPGLLTGGYGFGTTARRSDGGRDVAAILFLESPDERGVPHPTTRSLEFLVHELAHSYVNPIFDARKGGMRASAVPVFRQVERAMRAQAYTSYPIMVNESVVRALVILFLRERVTEEDARRSLDEQRKLSFLWTAELADALAAERLQNAGRLEPQALVSVTRRIFTQWSKDHG